MGVLTRIVTPLVWAGAAAVFFRGSAVWGFAYGVSFGMGRSMQLLIEYASNEPSASATVHRTVVTQAKMYRPVGLIVTLGLLLEALVLRGS